MIISSESEMLRYWKASQISGHSSNHVGLDASLMQMKVAMPQKNESPARGKNRADSSTDRVLGLLDLFSEEFPTWTADALIERQQVARATMYRYLRALVDTGFLSPLGGGTYALGPRVVQMDRLIRMIDPLLQHGPQVMAGISEAVNGGQLLCRYYGLSVISIHEHKTDPRIVSSFDRGRPFPLFNGSPSKAILAHLGQAQLQRLFLDNSREIVQAGLGGSWAEFKESMKLIRDRGFAVASDVDTTLVGISAPIFVPKDEVSAALCLIRLKKSTSEDDIEALGVLAMKAAAEISRLAQAATTKPLQAVTKARRGR